MPESEKIYRLVLADGTILDQSDCGYAEKTLWCYLKNTSFAEAFQFFSDPSKTNTIKFEYGNTNRYRRITYTGFTNITIITKHEFTIDVCMTGENTMITEEVIEDGRS